MRGFRSNAQSGITLVELLIALMMAQVALAAVFAVYWSVTRSSTRNEVTADVLQSLRTSAAFLEQDLRMTGLDRFGTANAGIESATATSIRFTADRSMDGTINGTPDVSDGIQEADLERITYQYDAGTRRLRQCLAEGTSDIWETVAENVQNFQFSYFDSADALLAFPIADLTVIRSVGFTMTVAEPAGFRRTVSRTLSKRVLLRNLSF